MVSRLEKITPTQLWYQDLVAFFYLSKFKVMGVKQIFNSFDTDNELSVILNIHDKITIVIEEEIDIYKSINKK